MGNLEGKKIIAGICGGIAAYKACDIVSSLHQRGAKVRVMMTPAACEFVNPLSFATLTHQKVLTDLWQEPLSHIEEAKGADLFLVMPATLNTISKVACGIADNLLTTAITATDAPVLFCPAMDSGMYENPIFQENMRKLKGLGNYHFLEPEEGRLASGKRGVGRFPEKSAVIALVERLLTGSSLLKGKKILITAGPTREIIDPIRCITNRSSGKMGYFMAQKALYLGAAQVLLISGSTSLAPPDGVEFLPVESADQMAEEVIRNFKNYEWIILAAAVADWRPKETWSGKMKKENKQEMEISFVKTTDIAKEVGKRRKDGQILVGFAAETEDLLVNAKSKLKDKNLDLIVANDITKEGAGPEVDTNIVSLISRDGKVENLPQMKKEALAEEILTRLAKAK